MKILKDKCGKWHFVSRLILPLPRAHGEVLVWLRKSQVPCPAQGGAVGQESGCVVYRNFGEWPWPQGNLRLFGTGNCARQHSRPWEAQKGPPLQRVFAVILETWCDHVPLEAVCCSCSTLVLEAALEMLLGTRQASTDEKFLPATPERE